MASFCNFSIRTVCQSILFTLKVKPSSHDAMVANAHADPKRVAVKLMRRSWELSDEQRGLPVRGTQTGGLTRRQFIRFQLMRLKLGEGLTQITYGTRPRRIASVEELLALKPELRGELGLTD